MAITNTYHSSKSNHSIKNARKLMEVQKHNSRGYLSFTYDKDRIRNIIGNSDNMVNDTKEMINSIFKDEVNRYNQQQSRKDRMIMCSPFEYFEKNKSLDVAVQSILQVGDQEFWSQYRIEEKKNYKGRSYVNNNYSYNVKEIMDNIYKQQSLAKEQIYKTHKDVILKKIVDSKEKAQEVVDRVFRDQPLYEKFTNIYNISNEDLADRKIKELLEDERFLFYDYKDAINTIQMISKLKLIERIENDQMHIKTVNLTTHYDEKSPHAHEISIVWADGYTSGLSSRIAKSVVLNKYTLEVLQDRLHEIAEKEMEKYPLLFNENLMQKKKGRNFDYSITEITRKNIEDKHDEYNRINTDIHDSVVRLEKSKADISASEMQLLELKKNNRELKETIEDMKETLRKTMSFKEKVELYISDLLRYIPILEELASVVKVIKGFPDVFMDVIIQIKNHFNLTQTWTELTDDFLNFITDDSCNVDEIIHLTNTINEQTYELSESKVRNRDER